MSHLEQAVELKAQLDALRPLNPDQEKRIWQKFRFDWNYHSNNIEGNSLTFGETKSLLLHNITAQGKPLKDHIEITGHNEAIDALVDLTRGDAPLTESFVRQLHKLILRERYQVDAITAEGAPTRRWIEVDQYKTSQNHVQTVTGEIFRFAEPMDVPEKMHKLLQSINDLQFPSSAEVVLVAAKAHYDFVLIHPFDDGNGRMARLLMNLVLIKYGFPPAIIKTEDKAYYFSALRQADGGQLDVFVEYIAGCVCASLEIMLAGARGEEIDDFDVKARQKIRALKRLLVTKGTHVAATKSPETVANAVINALFPLKAVALNALGKFAGLLVSINVKYNQRTLLGVGGQSYRPVSSREDVRDAAESGELVLRIELSGVRAVGLFAYQISWDIVVSLYDDHLRVHCEAIGLQLTVRYETALSEDQERLVGRTLTEHTMKWLQDITGIDIERALSG